MTTRDGLIRARDLVGFNVLSQQHIQAHLVKILKIFNSKLCRLWSCYVSYWVAPPRPALEREADPERPRVPSRVLLVEEEQLDGSVGSFLGPGDLPVRFVLPHKPRNW